eukprot:14075479-Alexandrium_andersonii.AAC.1
MLPCRAHPELLGQPLHLLGREFRVTAIDQASLGCGLDGSVHGRPASGPFWPAEELTACAQMDHSYVH